MMTIEQQLILIFFLLLIYVLGSNSLFDYIKMLIQSALFIDNDDDEILYREYLDQKTKHELKTMVTNRRQHEIKA